MTTRQAFLVNLIEDPNNDTLRKVFADFLQESEELPEELCERIRNECPFVLLILGFRRMDAVITGITLCSTEFKQVDSKVVNLELEKPVLFHGSTYPTNPNIIHNDH